MKKMRKDDIDFLEAYTYKTPIYEKIKPHFTYFIVPIIFLCVCSIVYLVVFQGHYYRQKMLLKKNQEEYSSLQQQTDHLTQTDEYQLYIENKKAYQIYKDMQEVIETYPQMNQKALVKIMDNYQVITSLEYKQEDKSITVQYIVPQQSFYEKLIQQMRKTEYFTDIEYIGYTGVEKTIDGLQEQENNYASTIVYKLK